MDSIFNLHVLRKVYYKLPYSCRRAKNLPKVNWRLHPSLFRPMVCCWVVKKYILRLRPWSWSPAHQWLLEKPELKCFQYRCILVPIPVSVETSGLGSFAENQQHSTIALHQDFWPYCSKTITSQTAAIL